MSVFIFRRVQDIFRKKILKVINQEKTELINTNDIGATIYPVSRNPFIKEKFIQTVDKTPTTILEVHSLTRCSGKIAFHIRVSITAISTDGEKAAFTKKESIVLLHKNEVNKNLSNIELESTTDFPVSSQTINTENEFLVIVQGIDGKPINWGCQYEIFPFTSSD